MEKIEYLCPQCLIDNNVPNEDLMHNVECYNCGEVFGVVNDAERDFGFTCRSFAIAELIKGEPIVEEEE